MGRYNKHDNSDIDRHILDASIHPRKIDGGMPVGTENQTIRRNATIWESTSILKINATGPENTIDHSTGTNPRIVNVVYVADPGSLVAANTVPVGTIGIIYIS